MRERKKIVIINGYLDIGGAEKVLTFLANLLCEKYDVTFAILQVSKNELFSLNDKVKLCQLNLERNRKSIKQMGVIGSLKYYINTAKIIRNFVKEENADAVIAFNDREVLLSWWALRKEDSVKLIFSQRNAPISKPRRTNIILRYIYNHCDGVVFQLKEVKDFYRIHNNLGVIIENPIKLYKNPQWRDEREKRIIAAGRLTEQKRFDILIKAFSKFYKEKSDYVLDIYGKGRLKEELERCISEEKLDEVVCIHEPIPNIMRHNSRAEMFVLSSDYEGIPNVLIEAMAEGIPCIATDCLPGGAKVVTNLGQSGLLIERGNIDAMYNAMKKLSENRDLQKEMVSNSFTYIQRFSEENISMKWMDFIDNMLNE